MDLLILANAADDVSAMDTVPDVSSPEEVYEIVSGDSLDFDSWTSLISDIEKTYSDNIKAISSVYESFLSWFPLCHEYWKRYANHMARLCTAEKAVQVFEQAVQSATYSVGLWVDYCSFCIHAFADPTDIRRTFERGLSFVGKDFLCHKLWDLYISFELSQQQWSFLAHILVRALNFPSKSLHKYYDNFREFTSFVEEDMSCAENCNLEPFSADSNVEIATFNDEIYDAIKELQDSSSVELRTKALHKFIAIAEQFYSKSCQLHERIDYFENYVDRDFYNVKPLDDEELQNWHNYLDFIEKQDDFDWAVKLYERCLIPCADYPEFWMRYVEFIESKGGRELAIFALERATQVFLKNVSEVHIYNASFRERIGDFDGARAAFHLCDTESDSSVIDTVVKKANMETRLGNMDTALEIYDKALKMAAEKDKMHIIPTLYIHFFRLKFLITGSADAAINLLLEGIQQVPHSRLLLEELINFAMMHEGSKHLYVVDSIIAATITSDSQGLSSKDREDLSLLYLKFVDYCGTIHDIRKAWNRHLKCFPHLIRSSSSHKYHLNRLSNKLKEPTEKVPGVVAKQPSRVHKIKHISSVSAVENHKSLASKSQGINPDKSTSNQYKEKGSHKSVKKKARMQSEDNTAVKLKRLKRQPSNYASKDVTQQKGGHENDVEVSVKPVSFDNLSLCTQEDEPISLEDAMPSVTHDDSNKKQTETDEHEPEADTQHISSQSAKTCKTDETPTASELTAHIVDLNQMPNQDHQNPNTENTQPQNSSSSLQLHLLPQLLQSMVQTVQSSEPQPGLIQNQQTYNQMWQYQYQQQQNQQMQQYYQQQQQQQAYMQQHQFHPQQYQLSQLQEQQMQQWLYMQQMYQQMPHNLQQNQQQQIAAMSNQIWNGSHDRQGQGMMPTLTANTYNVAYAQHNADVAAQPMTTSALTNIASPSNRLQSFKSHHSTSFE
ncbi:pre-mRNA-processing factor 39-2 [Rutidosis leptorrhynchoides]|uniref:pre-mRNA-processing factor 39-2 n=1 Tax=Rutidosis leptorrhynchoides TaxID=125765 RepID=UPI003A99047A